MIMLQAGPFETALNPGKTALVVIDIQRDFVEPGGFGASLGNDVTRLHSAIAPIASLLAAWRARGWPVLHTRECHSPDLSDCPPAKRERGNPGLRIGDVGPMGRVLIAGEPGAQIIAELAPHGDEWVIDKPGKGMFWVHGGKFEVCEITLKNRGLKKEQFIKEADFTPSGVVRIAKLQKQGFAYLKP